MAGRPGEEMDVTLKSVKIFHSAQNGFTTEYTLIRQLHFIILIVLQLSKHCICIKENKFITADPGAPLHCVR